MPKLFTTLTILLIAVAGFAQVQLFNTDSLIKKYSRPDFNKMRRIQNYQAIQQQLKLLQPTADTARYSFSNSAGDIYNLPKSNMPCLRPFNVEPNSSPINVHKNPPVVSPLTPANKMPNVYEGNTLVFEGRH